MVRSPEADNTRPNRHQLQACELSVLNEANKEGGLMQKKKINKPWLKAKNQRIGESVDV